MIRTKVNIPNTDVRLPFIFCRSLVLSHEYVRMMCLVVFAVCIMFHLSTTLFGGSVYVSISQFCGKVVFSDQ